MEFTAKELKTRRKQVACQWRDFDKKHAEIMELCDKPENFASLSKAFQDAASINTDCLAILDKAEELNPATTTPAVADIKLEKFSGAPTEWVEWRAIFEERVLKTALKPSQKIDLMLGALEGEAKMVAGRSLKRDALEQERMWGKLVSRYDNEFKQIFAHVHNIISQPDVTSESSKQFRDMINQIEEDMRLLGRYDVMNDWDTIVGVIVMLKLDTKTRYLWNTKAEKPKRPSAKELFAFLLDRSHALDNESQTQDSRAKRQPREEEYVPSPVVKYESKAISYAKQSVQETRQQPKPYDRPNEFLRLPCVACKETSHMLFKCSLFTAMTSEQRLDFVDRLRLCNRCMASHPTSECRKFFKCKKCGSPQHNSLLCLVNSNIHEEKPRRSN